MERGMKGEDWEGGSEGIKGESRGFERMKGKVIAKFDLLFSWLYVVLFRKSYFIISIGAYMTINGG